MEEQNRHQECLDEHESDLEEDMDAADDEIDDNHEDDEAACEENEHDLSVLNESLLSSVSVSPIKPCEARRNKTYAKRKLVNTSEAIKAKVEASLGIQLSDEEAELEKPEEVECEMVAQIKERFQEATRREQVTLLTMLPKSWSVNKTRLTIGCSRYMAEEAKRQVARDGILSTPGAIKRQRLPVDAERLVRDYFKGRDVARIITGTKDCVRVPCPDGGREKAQKQLVLCNLREAYALLFCQQNPQIKIGFSKFSEFRPKECVLAGGSGTHAVCVCTYHQNVKLMFGAIRKYFDGDNEVIKSYRDLLSQMDILNTKKNSRHLVGCTPFGRVPISR